MRLRSRRILRCVQFHLLLRGGNQVHVQLVRQLHQVEKNVGKFVRDRGALQAASRTLMVRHTTAARATEAFGLYALSGKATAFLAPFSIAAVTQITGNQRLGISPLIVMFLLSLVLLHWVNPEGEVEQ